jgi:opacity protein-like surface antigen
MSNKFKKKYILPIVAMATALGITANVNAAEAGAYVGGQLGWGNVHQGNYAQNTTEAVEDVGTFSSHIRETETGMAGRIFGGYQFNQNIAAEVGYTRFHNATQTYDFTSGMDDASVRGSLKTDAFDIVAKGILPLTNGFNLYGKLGVAYLRAAETMRVYGTDGSKFKISDNAHDVYPTFSAGAGYDVTKNVTTDLSWTRIQKVGNSHNSTLPSTDLFAAGVAYHFG